ncbi:hypothetical protein Syun_008418 [Stephania yunnanensis]|uniref:CASP-like protein n=1 Tax=Stephania yunnanensis TaxID=152371 RepID=A0AAP0KEI3_9MAGN
MAKFTKRVFTILLRLLALAATLSATIVMITSHETSSLLNFSLDVTYSDTPAFKYFMIVNAAVSVYSLLILFLPPKSQLWRLIVALDVIIAMVLISGNSAALAVAYVGKKGNSSAGWLPICGQFPKFCNQVTGALVAGFIGALVYLVLILNSIHDALNPLLV